MAPSNNRHPRSGWIRWRLERPLRSSSTHVQMCQVLLSRAGTCLLYPCNSGESPPWATVSFPPPVPLIRRFRKTRLFLQFTLVPCGYGTSVLPASQPSPAGHLNSSQSSAPPTRDAAPRPRPPCGCRAEPASHYPLTLGGVLTIVSPIPKLSWDLEREN